MAQIYRNWHKKNQIGESDGERKKNPRANPDMALLGCPPFIIAP